PGTRSSCATTAASGRCPSSRRRPSASHDSRRLRIDAIMKAMDPARNLELALDLFAAGEAMMRQSLRRRFPGASEAEIQARLDAWLAERPGAEAGDAPGRTVAWPRRR